MVSVAVHRWLRMTKSVGLSPTLVSSKSLRHFAAVCAQNGGTETTLPFASFLTGLGLCAIYVHREHQDEWSTREKAVAMLHDLSAREPALDGVKVPQQFLGPRVEGFLYRIFDHFSSKGSGKAKVLSNWGWSKLLKELRLDGAGAAQPDVMFSRYASRGKGLSFEAFIQAITELDRVLAQKSSAERTVPFSPSAVDQENRGAPLSAVLGDITSRR